MNRKAETGDVVRVHYTGRLDNGEVFDSSRARDEPLQFQLGTHQVIPGFERAVDGMKVGEKREVRLEPEDAYGRPRDDLLVQVPRDQLPAGHQPTVGDAMRLQDAHGQEHTARIASVGDQDVTLDLNHPLSGQALTFELELVEVD